MPSKSSISKKCFLPLKALMIAIVFSTVATIPVHAYYFGPGYGYAGYGRNLLYSVPYLAGSLVGVRSPYSANPLYSATSLFSGSSRRLLTVPYQAPYVMQQYQDPEPLYNPRTRYRQVRPGSWGVDEIAHAQLQAPNKQYLTPSMPPSEQNEGPLYDPFAPLPEPGYSTGDGFPPVAPPIASSRGTSSSPRPMGASPLAEGFLNLVDTRFDGNIQDALFDPKTRSWARTLGLIDEDQLFSQDFEPTRTHIIQQVIRDKTLDPISKLNAIKILLPPGKKRDK